MKKDLRFLTFLSLASALALSGCGNVDGSVFSPLTIWSASSVNRISREDSSMDTRQKKMEILMAKNEKEGAQLMLRSSSSIKAYHVSVSDLISNDHRYVIPAENISLYNAKYISSVGMNPKYNNPSLPSGSSIPDALLPFDTAVEYGENTLPSEVNQSVYIEVKTDKNTMAGTYNGQIKVLADSYAHYLPITVKVIDYAIPDSPSTKNHFAMWGTEHFNSAELSSGDEMVTTYFESMLDYRMSSSLPFEGEGGPTKYVELLRKYYNAPGFSSYKFFYEATYSWYNDMMIPFNVSLCKDYLRAVVNASLEDNVNYLDKAFFYFSTFVDEPDTNPMVTWEMVKQIATTVKKVLTDLAEELDSSLSTSSNYSYYASTVRETLINIPNTIPGGYSISTLENAGAGDISACINLDHYNSKEMRDSYRRSGGQEEWWYTCIGPQYPYPNLLINSYLAAPRLISWMQKYYDVDGFLIWDAANYTDGDNNGTPIVNGYDDLSSTMSGVSDGKIFYPGAPYGIQGPIGSLRAVSYRDGMEDYEILQAIYDRYEEYGLSAEEALDEVMKKEFSGTVVNGSDSDFDTSRRSVMELYESITSSTALLYGASVQGETSNDQVVSFILPNSGAKASVNGTELAKDNDGYYRIGLNANSNPSVDIVVSVGNKKSAYTKRITDIETLLTGFEDGNTDGWSVDRYGSMTISSENAKAGSSSLAITLNGRDKNKSYQPSFALEANKLGDASSLSEISFSLCLPKDMGDSYKMSVSASYGSAVTYNTDVGDVYLKQGWNNVKLSIQESIRSLENLEEFRFYLPNILDEEDNPSSLTIYLDDCAYRSLKRYEDSSSTDFGSVAVSKSEEEVAQGNKQSLIVKDDAKNVEVEENGEKYLMLGDFENYNQIAQIRYENKFGTISLAEGSPYVTHGEKAMKMEIVGRGETLKKLDPVMTIFTSAAYFQKNNFSDVDYLEADFYNAMDYDIPVRFSNTNIYYSQFTTLINFTLKPGTNHIRLDLSVFDSKEFSTLNFIFNRGEYYDEKRVVYLDNFRAHYAKEAE